MNKKQLIDTIKLQSKDNFGKFPDQIIITPARVNIIGEHTDYNQGLSMPTAINYWMCAGISHSSSKNIRLYSLNFDKVIEFNKNKRIQFKEVWQKLAYEATLIINKKYHINTSFNISIGGNIPIGCGLSSSTAFVISFVYSILSLLSINLSKMDLAILCNKIENKALGTSTGFLDQYGIIFSKPNQFLLIDFRDDKIQYLPSITTGYSWIVINSKINRELSLSEYKDRVNECISGFHILKTMFDIQSIRDINFNMISHLKEKNRIIYNRMKHIIDENNRVLRIKNYINNTDYKKIGSVLIESHESLKSLYEVSCDEIDYMINFSLEQEGWLGGRIMGGGFGGCTINLIDNKYLADYKSKILYEYNCKFNVEVDFMNLKFCGGIQKI